MLKRCGIFSVLSRFIHLLSCLHLCICICFYYFITLWLLRKACLNVWRNFGTRVIAVSMESSGNMRFVSVRDLILGCQLPTSSFIFHDT